MLRPPNSDLRGLVVVGAVVVARTGFSFTVLDPVTDHVIGCVYLYPTHSDDIDADVTIRSWVRVSHAELDEPLAQAVREWLAAVWPWHRAHRPGR